MAKPAVPLAVAAAILLIFAIGQWAHANQQAQFELYGTSIGADDIGQNSCHDLRYPEIRCFTTWQEMFDDQIRLRPSRATLLEDKDKPAFVIRDGVRSSAASLASFEGCHALSYPEIRCFATERAALQDAISNFPERAGSARQRLAEPEHAGDSGS